MVSNKTPVKIRPRCIPGDSNDYINDITARPIENSEIIKLVRKIWDLQIKIRNLDLELKVETEAANILLERAKKSEQKVINIQEIIFENSEEIPSGVYLKLMNSLI